VKIQYTPPCYLESLSYWLFCKWDTGFRVCGIEFDWEEEEPSGAWTKPMDDVESMKIKVQGPGRVVFYKEGSEITAYEIDRFMDEIIAEHHNRHSSGS